MATEVLRSQRSLGWYGSRLLRTLPRDFTISSPQKDGRGAATRAISYAARCTQFDRLQFLSPGVAYHT